MSGGRVVANGELIEGTWKFTDILQAPEVSDSNKTTYNIRFYPKDFKQYKRIDTAITINVNKSELTPYYPNAEDDINEIYTGCIDGKIVSDVSLSDYPGLKWTQESEETELILNEFVEATAEYVGDDKDNYSNTIATFKIKMNECDHKFTCTEASEPTCQLTGVMVYSCNNCDVSYRVNNPKKPRLECDYQLNEEESRPLTCTSSGITVYTCTMCKKSYREVTKFTGHELGGAEYKEATCVEEGYNNYPCKNCDFAIVNIIPTLSHNYNIDAYTSPTCTAAGSVTKTCEFCNKTVNEVLNASGHKFNVVRVEATCTTDGSEIRTCTRGHCKHKETDILKAFGHNIKATWTERVATCEIDGLQIDYCITCQKNMESIIPRKGHIFNNIFYPATTLEGGYDIAKCKNNCGKTNIIDISKIDTIELSDISYVYDGQVKTPKVIVKDVKGKVLSENADYTVSYSIGRKEIGTYNVTITFKGNYSGIITKSFVIKKAVEQQKIINKPKATSIIKLTARKKGFIVKWKKVVRNNTGYQLQYSTSKSFNKKTTKTVTIGKTKTVSKTVSKLKAKKNYYVRIRCYRKVKLDSKTKTLYSNWSLVKKIKTKK